MSYCAICWLQPTASSLLSFRHVNPVTSELVTGSSLCKLRPLSKFHTCREEQRTQCPLGGVKMHIAVFCLFVFSKKGPWWCHCRRRWKAVCGRSPVPSRWLLLLRAHLRYGASSSPSPRPTWIRTSRRVRSPAASGWGCTGHRTGGPGCRRHCCCAVKPQTSHPLLLSPQPVGAEPDNLCSQPLNGPAGSGRGSAAGRGSCRVPGSERAAGRGTAGGRFSDSDGWKCPKPWVPCKKK